MFDTIAVIDNNSERRSILYEVLTELNYQVTTLPSTKEFYELLKRDRPKCVIVAAEQPDILTGLLRKLRSLDKVIKIVLLSPSEQTTAIADGIANDPRVLVIDARTDRLGLLRSILGFLKTREVERLEPPSTSTPGAVVLIVEDDPHSTELLSGYLQRRGYQVVAATTGEEALVHMRVKHPKVVILDILLPGMDGLLVLKRLKALDPSITVIVSSGLDDTKLIDEAKASGAAAYLVKPFDLAKLEATILTSTLQQLKE